MTQSAQARNIDTVCASYAARVVALLLDVLLLFFLTLMVEDWLEGTAGYPAGPRGQSRTWLLLGLGFAYFTLLARTPLRGSLGKWIFRIRLSDPQGRSPGWRAAFLRAGAMLVWFGGIPQVFALMPWYLESGGWPFWGGLYCLYAAIPLASAGFMPHRESLFDLIATTRVVRIGAGAQAVAGQPPLARPSRSNAAVIVFPWALFAYMMVMIAWAYLDRNLRSRVSYAIKETDDARRKIAAFRQREQRWPDPAEVNLPEWTAYRDGGGFRLLQGGRVRISFTVIGGLKGYGIALSPAAPAGDGSVFWNCEPDSDIKPHLLLGQCRENSMRAEPPPK